MIGNYNFKKAKCWEDVFEGYTNHYTFGKDVVVVVDDDWDDLIEISIVELLDKYIVMKLKEEKKKKFYKEKIQNDVLEDVKREEEQLGGLSEEEWEQLKEDEIKMDVVEYDRLEELPDWSDEDV